MVHRLRAKGFAMVIWDCKRKGKISKLRLTEPLQGATLASQHNYYKFTYLFILLLIL